jgi:hypothetical protein
MESGHSRKPLKIGVKEGDGEPPGYEWTVLILDVAFKEAMKFLDENQYDHVARQFRELAKCREPTQCQTVDVRNIEDFFELRDKGGILGRINIRVFFHVDRERRKVAVLGTINKTNDGKTPAGVRIQMRRRKRQYQDLMNHSNID